ncbi:MAG: hypothetical protein R2695_15515 [Acidimicrobiales bacterium]
MSRRLRILLLAGALLLPACADDGSSAVQAPAPPTEAAAAPVPSTGSSGSTAAPPSTVAAPGYPYPIVSETVTFVDEDRATPATAEQPARPSRTLEVWVDRPAVDAPRPLVVFAHGLSGHPRSHELLRRTMAEAGFVVVAPAFPLTNHDVPGAWGHAADVDGQVGDISFLIDAVVADPDLGPLVDAEHIGMIGHSLGGLTTAGAALAAGGDERIDAAVVISAGFGQSRAGLPVMVVHGDVDQLVPYQSGTMSYGLLTGRRMFVTLVGGDHIAGILDDDTDLGLALRGLVDAFFARELGVDEGQVAAVAGLPLDQVDVQAGTADGVLTDWRDYFAG